MKATAITTIAVAGLATIASAQTIGTVTLTSTAATINVGEMVTISVIVSDNIAGNSVFAFDVQIQGAGTAAFTMGGPVEHPSIFGFSGSTTGSIVTGLGGASDILGPTLDPSLDDLAVFTFTVTGHSVGQFTLTATDGPGPNSAMIWGEEGGVVILPMEYDNIIFGSVGGFVTGFEEGGLTINVVPAPSGLALLALGALGAARRRRRR